MKEIIKVYTSQQTRGSIAETDKIRIVKHMIKDKT